MTRLIVATMLAAGWTSTATGQDRVSEAEAKAAATVKRIAAEVEVDNQHPDKPVVGVFFYGGTANEALAGLLKELKHLRTLRGYDLKFKPGVIKALKDHSTLETITLHGFVDADLVKELSDGPRIKTLILGFTKLTPEHAEAIARVSSLREFRVALQDTKPDVLRPLHKMEALEALDVQVLGGRDAMSAEDVGGFTRLKELRCSLPPASEPFFAAVGGMKPLRKLILSPTVTYPAPPAGLGKIGGLTDLTELRLGFPVGDANLKALAGLKSLESFTCQTHGMTAEGVKALGAFPRLVTLKLTGPLPDAAQAGLKELIGLKTLTLGVDPLSAPGLEALGSLGNLESLTLQGLRGADGAMAPVAKLAKLRVLDLTSSDLTDAGLEKLSGLKGLETLKVGGTKTTQAGKAAIRKALPKVTVAEGSTTGDFGP